MAENPHTLSYASVHWQSFSDGRVENADWLVDVARLEGELRAAANEFAGANNYDYGDRVMAAGRCLINEATGFGLVGLRSGLWSQMLHMAQNRRRVPMSQWAEVSEAELPVYDIPPQVESVLNTAWENFAANNVTIPEKYKTLNNA